VITVSGPCPECGFMVESFYTATDHGVYALIMTCENCGESFNLHHEGDCVPLSNEMLTKLMIKANEFMISEVELVMDVLTRWFEDNE